jgi:hypothetical protein
MTTPTEQVSSSDLVEQVLSENPYPAYSYTAQSCVVECQRANRYARALMREVLLRRGANEPRPAASNSLLTDLLDVLRSYHDGRCYACGWSLADGRSTGCIPGDCSYRPSEVHPSYKHWRERMEVMTRVIHAITHPLQYSGHEPGHPVPAHDRDVNNNPRQKCCFEGECARTACTNRPAVYFNRSTRRYYCEDCANKINRHEQETICVLVAGSAGAPARAGQTKRASAPETGVHPDLRADAKPHCRECGGPHWVGAHDAQSSRGDRS